MPVIVLAGPTACGKSQVASALAKLTPTEMIACDSMQVYRGMRILSQAPSKTHLASFLSPAKEYSAALFRENAGRLIPKILAKKKTPVIVGGTGLYLTALLDGLFPVEEGASSRDMAFRRELEKERQEKGAGFLHDQLRRVDPPSAEKIHPNDVRRLIRALEVHHLTGRPFSMEKPRREGLRRQYPFLIFVLNRDRAELYARINQRVDRMTQEGLVGEVQKLLKRSLSQTAAGALGIKELKAHLEGQATLSEAVELLKKNTRNYAKRQLCWFRREKAARWIEIAPDERPKETAQKIINVILTYKSTTFPYR